MNKVHFVKLHLYTIINFLWLLVALLFMWFVLQFQNVPMLMLMGLFVVLPAWSIGTAYLTARGLQTDRRNIALSFPQESVTVGDETYMEIVIHNTLWLPTPALVLEFSLQNQFCPTGDLQVEDIPSIAPGQTRHIRFPIQPIHCGCIEGNVLKIRLRDWFGLVTLETEQDCVMAELEVYPKLAGTSVEIEESAGGSNEEAEPQQEKGYTSSEILDVRPYIPGDRLQAIHWKLSAKAGELMVKEYESMSADHFQLLPDLNTGNPDSLDRMLELLYSLGMQLLHDRGMGFSIYYWSTAESKMIVAPVHEEAEMLAAFVQMYHQNLGDMLHGQVLQAYRQFGTGRSGYLLYLTTDETVPEGELMECYRDSVYLFNVVS